MCCPPFVQVIEASVLRYRTIPCVLCSLFSPCLLGDGRCRVTGDALEHPYNIPHPDDGGLLEWQRKPAAQAMVLMPSTEIYTEAEKGRVQPTIPPLTSVVFSVPETILSAELRLPMSARSISKAEAFPYLLGRISACSWGGWFVVS